MKKKYMMKHNQLPNGVHEFVFMTDQREAIDLYFDWVAEVFLSSPKTGTIRYIIDWSQSGVPNLNYMFLKTKEWGRIHKGVANGRCVILYDQRGFMPIGKALSKLIMQDWKGKVAIELYHVDRREMAMDWLLQSEANEATQS